MRRARGGSLRGTARIATAAGMARLRLPRGERKAVEGKKHVSHERGMSYGRDPGSRELRPRSRR